MKEIKHYTVGGAFFVSILGTLAHFCYQWTGNNPIIGLVTPINESTWEHMKLLFFPALLFSPFIIHRLKNSYPNICAALFRGITVGTLCIPVLFYTYTGILGFDLLPMDIGVFLASTAAAFVLTYNHACNTPGKASRLYKGGVAILAAAFFIFTYFPPSIGLFANPLA